MPNGERIANAQDVETIAAILAGIPDPEIPAVSIVDIGIVRAISQTPPIVQITPTYTGCPATLAIEHAIRQALDAAGFAHFVIKTVLAPPWTTDWISATGRQKLKAYGIAPPQSRELEAKPAECPHCNSTNTEEISRFGSTPCKALWRCNTCQEPFDRFKCH